MVSVAPACKRTHIEGFLPHWLLRGTAVVELYACPLHLCSFFLPGLYCLQRACYWILLFLLLQTFDLRSSSGGIDRGIPLTEADDELR